MSNDTTVNNLIINTLTKTQFESIENPSSTQLYLVEESESSSNVYALDEEVVHKIGTETISGDKTFTGSVVLNNATAVTQELSDDSNALATTAYVQDVIASLVARIEALENN